MEQEGLQHKRNYIFNTSIQNIDKSDFILLIGSNPRHEATIVNLRIRKAIVKNNAQVYSIGNPGSRAIWQSHNLAIVQSTAIWPGRLLNADEADPNH